MSPALRQYLISELVPGIQAIGRQFEAFGARYIDAIVGCPMTHPGLNTQGQPVGHTVDSVSEDGLTAAEYTSEEGYFSKPYTKVRKDYEHVRRLQPQATTVHLVCSRLAGPGARTRLTRFCSNVKTHLDIEVRIHDARVIAEKIVDDLLLNDGAIDSLVPYLGPLEKVRDEYAATLLIPELSRGYIPHPEFQAELARRLRTDQYAAIAGISGSGKSETATAVAHELSQDFDLIVWVPATTIAAINDIKGIDVERRGHRINMLSLLKDRSCLMVLDDLRVAIPPKSLLVNCGAKSAVLITRQDAQPDDMEMPQLDEADSRQLLQHGIADPCPDDLFSDVRDSVGGHPLALKLMNAGVKRGGWEALRTDCQAIGEYHDEERMQKLADRLLGRQKSTLERGLAFFAWCDSSRVDRTLARLAIKPVGIRNLEDACLLAPDRQDALRIHDIVKAAVTTLEIHVGKFTTGFNATLDSHIEALVVDSSDDLTFFTLCQLHRGLLTRLLREDPNRYGCLYVLLHSWSNDEIDTVLIGNLSQRAADITSTLYPSDVQVVTIVEAMEALYRREKWTSGPTAAKEVLRSQMAIFENLTSAKNLSEATHLRVLHHKAKALRNLKQFADATPLCRQILEKQNLRATRLLLARLLAFEESSRKEAKDLLVGLLEEAQNDPHSDISVTLAAITVLGQSQLEVWLRDALTKYGPFLAMLILEAAARGFDHAFVAFAAIGRNLQFNDEQLFFQIFDQLPIRALDDVRDDSERAAWGDILLAAAKAKEGDKREGLLAEALQWYESLRQPKPYHLQQKGQTLYLLRKYGESAAVLGPLVEESPNPWNRYWLSKCLLATKDNAGALRLIDEALDDSRSDRFRSAMLEHRYDVRIATNDSDAASDLREAFDRCENPKYKAALAKRLESLR